MKRTLPIIAAAAVIIATATAQQPSPAPATSPQQPSEVSTTISSDQAGSAPRFAVPDFIALSKDAETVDAAQTIGRVLWDDLNFEREFALIPQRRASPPFPPRRRWPTCRSIAGAKSTPTASSSVPCRRPISACRVEVRLFNVRSRQSAFAREYSGSVAQEAPVRAHDCRRDPPAAARAARRRPDQADLQLRSQTASG